MVAEAPNTLWKPATSTNWYRSGERTVEIASQKAAVWYSTGLFAVPVRWVIWCAIPKEGSKPRLSSCVPTLTLIYGRSSVGL